MFIKCKECGKEISDTCDECIHCGFRLKENANLSEEKKLEVVAIRSKSGGLSGGIVAIIMGSIMLAIGLYFVLIDKSYINVTLIIFGLVFVGLGINNINESRKNYNNQHECAYYDQTKEVFLLYSIAGEKYEVRPESIVEVYKPVGVLNLYVKFNDNGRIIKLDCGFCEKTSVMNFLNYVENIKVAKKNMQ